MVRALIVADIPGLSLRGSGYSTLYALLAGSRLYVNLMTCTSAQRGSSKPLQAIDSAMYGMPLTLCSSAELCCADMHVQLQQRGHAKTYIC
jgi:hypothetical protein